MWMVDYVHQGVGSLVPHECMRKPDVALLGPLVATRWSCALYLSPTLRQSPRSEGPGLTASTSTRIPDSHAQCATPPSCAYNLCTLCLLCGHNTCSTSPHLFNGFRSLLVQHREDVHFGDTQQQSPARPRARGPEPHKAGARGAMRQRKLGSHTPPCHRRMVIITLFSVLLAALQRRPVLYHTRWLLTGARGGP